MHSDFAPDVWITTAEVEIQKKKRVSFQILKSNVFVLRLISDSEIECLFFCV